MTMYAICDKFCIKLPDLFCSKRHIFIKEAFNLKKHLFSYGLIIISSIMYAFATVVFIFPKALLLGGTSGIAVILNTYFPLSPGTFSVAINLSLIVLAFFVLGTSMAGKTLVGSAFTTLFIGLFEKIFSTDIAVVPDMFLSSVIGAAIIALASGIMFYVDSSSGGTDIIALIVRKYSDINIGKSLLLTDFLIVIVGGILAGRNIFVCSFAGLLVKTLGIDFVIGIIKSSRSKKYAKNKSE